MQVARTAVAVTTVAFGCFLSVLIRVT